MVVSNKHGSWALSRQSDHLSHASACGHLGKVKALIAEGVPVNRFSKTTIEWGQQVRRRTPLMWAAHGGHAEIIKVLLAAGAGRKIHAKDEKGNTPLHLARKGDAVDELIAHGARLDKMNADGLTPLENAIKECHYPSAIQAMAKAGASLTSNLPWVLDRAVVEERANIAPMLDALIEAGWDVSAHDWEGKTLLHRMVERLESDVVVMLLDRGADPYAKLEEPVDTRSKLNPTTWVTKSETQGSSFFTGRESSVGDTVFEIAKKQENRPVLAALERYHANKNAEALMDVDASIRNTRGTSLDLGL